MTCVSAKPREPTSHQKTGLTRPACYTTSGPLNSLRVMPKIASRFVTGIGTVQVDPRKPPRVDIKPDQTPMPTKFETPYQRPATSLVPLPPSFLNAPDPNVLTSSHNPHFRNIPTPIPQPLTQHFIACHFDGRRNFMRHFNPPPSKSP
jgi:hypothetical protein